jgi:hypothetical protein
MKVPPPAVLILLAACSGPGATRLPRLGASDPDSTLVGAYAIHFWRTASGVRDSGDTAASVTLVLLDSSAGGTCPFDHLSYDHIYLNDSLRPPSLNACFAATRNPGKLLMWDRGATRWQRDDAGLLHLDLWGSPDAWYRLTLSIRGDAVEGFGQAEFAPRVSTPPIEHVVGRRLPSIDHDAS